MAKRFTVAELVVGVTADLRSVRKSLKEGTADIKTFSREASTSLDDAKKFGTGLAVIAGTIAGTGALAVKVFADLEQSIANTASVTGSTSKEMQMLEGYARKMGKETVFTANQAADAMYYLASAGYDTRRIFSSLQPILALAASTQYDLSETTATVVSTLRAFNLEAHQASRISNVFAGAISSSQATMLKLQESMKYIAPVASNLNYSIEDTVAALTQLFDSGLEASMSGTQLRMGLIRLQKPTQQARQAMKDLGLEYDDLNPATNSLVDIIRALEDANAGAAESGKQMAQIFGVRAVNAFNILLRRGPEALETMSAVITGTTKAADMQQRQIDTLKGTWRLMTSALEESAINIGSTLQPALRAVLESVRTLNLWFSNLSSTAKTLITITVSLIGAFTGVGAVILKVVGNFTTLIAMWKFLNISIMGSLGAITAVTAAIIALAAAIVYLTSRGEREQRQRKAMIADLSNFISKREKEAKQTIGLTKAYSSLYKELDGNETKQRRMSNVVDELNQKYPGLISKEESYAKQLKKVNGVATDVSDSLEEISKAKEKIRNISLTTDLIEAQEELKDLKKELNSANTIIENIGDNWNLATTKGIKGGREELSSFKNDLESIDKDLANVVMNSLGAKSYLGEMQVDLGKTEQYFKSLVKEGTSLNTLLDLETALTNKILDYEDEITKRQTDQRRNGMDITGENKKRIPLLESSKAQLNLINAELQDAILLQEQITGQEQKIAELRDARRKKEEGGKGGKDKKLTLGMFPEDSDARKQALDYEKLMYDIAIAGAIDRNTARKLETQKWYKEQISMLMDQKDTEAEAIKRLEGALAKRLRDDRLASEQETNAVLLSLSEKGVYDIMQMKINRAQEEKRKLLSEAEELGISRTKVEEAFEREIAKIRTDEQNARDQLINSMTLQAMSEQAEIIRNEQDKQIAIENVAHQRKLEDLRKYTIEQNELVEQGRLDQATVDADIRARTETEEKHHKQVLNDIERDHIIKTRKASNEAKAAYMNSLAITETKTARSRMLAEERAYHQERLNAIESNAIEMFSQVESGQMQMSDLVKNYNADLEAEEILHKNKMSQINLDYVSRFAEQQLSLVDYDNDLYDRKLEAYKQFLQKQLNAFTENSDERERLELKISDVEEEQRKRNLKQAKETVDQNIKYFELIGEAAGKAGQGQTDAWKEAAKAGVKITSERLFNWAKGEAAIALASGNLLGASAWAAAATGIRALENISYGRIEAARTGARVQKSGVAEVHKDEIIIPKAATEMTHQNLSQAAKLQRSTFSSYMNDLTTAVAGNGKSTVPNINIPTQPERINKMQIELNMHIDAQGSILTGDVDAQDAFYEKCVKPAESRFKRSVGEYIESIN